MGDELTGALDELRATKPETYEWNRAYNRLADAWDGDEPLYVSDARRMVRDATNA